MKRFVCILAITVFIGRAFAQVPLSTARISASSEERELTATMAFDGKMDTRWSSKPSDEQWLQIDFNSPVELVGLTLRWETAYGRDYEIELLNTDGNWYSVSQVHFGDGGIDEIYFGPKKTKAIRFVGHKRGTGWGYSLFEIGILGLENRILAKASSCAAGTDANAVLDGSDKTIWTAGQTDANATLEIIFPKKFDVGGLQINWAGSHSPSCKIQMLTQKDGQWETITNKKAGQSKIEDVFFKAVSAEKLRLVFDRGNSEPVGICDIQIKGTSEAWTAVRHFEMLAQRMPAGILPDWLGRKQTFWTVTGLPGSFNESLLDEYGGVETGLRCFSVIPAILADGKLLSAKNFELQQSLAEDWMPIPTVNWKGGGINLNITANTIEPDTTLVLYKLTNTSSDKRDISLLLAARPLQINPPWQFGGFSEIKQAQWKDNRSLTLNDKQAACFYPTADFVSTYGQSPTADSIDIIEYLIERKTVGDSISSPDGIVSAGARYDYSLAAGESKFILAVYPNTDNANVNITEDYKIFFNKQLNKSMLSWQKFIGDWDINIPDKKLVNIVRSNLAYLLINADGPATQPGSRNYNNSWIRDGAISATAMMRFGLVDFGEKYLQWFTPLIKDDGLIPFIVETKTGNMAGFAADWVGEYDSFGQYAFLVRQVMEITDDNDIAKQCWPKLKVAMKYMENLRNQRLTDKYRGTEYEGILPESISHEGYFPAKHSYWDDFFALKGLQDAQAIASRLGYKEDEQWLAKLEKDLRASTLASIEKVRSRDNLKTLPGCAELGDFDPTSTAVAIMIADERDNLPADALKATFDKYMQDSKDRASMPIGKRSTYTPYEARNVGALIRLGRFDDARMMLEFFVSDGVRPAAWNHLAEVVHGDLRTPSYIGDMPHTWVGAEMINSIRDMLVYEDRGRLVLAAGVPDSWLTQGVSVRNLQTLWGPISYTLKRQNDGQAVLELICSKQPPNGIVVPTDVKLVIKKKTETAN